MDSAGRGMCYLCESCGCSILRRGAQLQVVHGSFADVADFVVLGDDHKLVINADLCVQVIKQDSTTLSGAVQMETVRCSPLGQAC